MKFHLDPGDLKRGLALLKPYVAKASTKRIFECVKIRRTSPDSIELVGTDLEVAAVVEIALLQQQSPTRAIPTQKCQLTCTPEILLSGVVGRNRKSITLVLDTCWVFMRPGACSRCAVGPSAGLRSNLFRAPFAHSFVAKVRVRGERCRKAVPLSCRLVLVPLAHQYDAFRLGVR